MFDDNPQPSFADNKAALSEEKNPQRIITIPNEEEESLIKSFVPSFITEHELSTLEIPKRENILGSWFKQGDLGFIYGKRGLGKTWFTHNMIHCIGEGIACGPWECTKVRKGLYIDGEMPLDGMQERVRTLSNGKYSSNISFLSHERFLHKGGELLNFSDPLKQQGLLKDCIDEKIELVVIDNLSCLFSGMEENQADSWEVVLPWLLGMRRHRISVIVIHHANRTGKDMRGTSRREDAATWVIRLEDVSNSVIQEGEGAKFITRFTKNRQGTEIETAPKEWLFNTSYNSTEVTFKPISMMELFLQWIKDGLTSCTDIAHEMEISKGQVSKLATKAEKEGWLEKKGEGRGTTYKLK